jgi:hypothetical protein
MTDDTPKVVRLPTNYEPEPDHDVDLAWSLTLLHDEISQLSQTIAALTKGLRVLSNKVHEIHKHIRKE